MNGTTHTPNLFQVSRPNTGFGIFRQTNTGTTAFGQTSQPTFGTNFGKLTTTTFAQPTQPAFGTNLSGLQQQPLFGNNEAKLTSLFGNTTGGGSLFTNNVFQQTPTSFSLNMNQQQQLQFPPKPADDSKNISLLATDSFPDGPHVYGLEPVLGDSSNSTTNPQDIKALLDYSKKRDELLGTRSKIKVHFPKPKKHSRVAYQQPSQQHRLRLDCSVNNHNKVDPLFFSLTLEVVLVVLLKIKDNQAASIRTKNLPKFPTFSRFRLPTYVGTYNIWSGRVVPRQEVTVWKDIMKSTVPHIDP